MRSSLRTVFRVFRLAHARDPVPQSDDLHRCQAKLNVEALESRDLLSADPLGGITGQQLLSAFPDASIQQTIVSTDSPANHIAGADSPFAGVGRVEVLDGAGNPLGFCSGTLLEGESHVLTAAHCLEDASSVRVSWVTPDGSVVVESSDLVWHPDWNTANPLAANDIGLIRLSTPVEGVPSYAYHEGSSEKGEVATIAGYGLTGRGRTGAQPGTDGTLHTVENRLDDTYTPTGSLPPDEHPMLAFDYDSGRWWQDTIGLFFGIRDRGLGSAREGMFAPGDSGGGTFIEVGGEWQVAGVNSFLLSFGWPFDRSIPPNGLPNSSFSELGFVTRTSAYAEWIEGAMVEGIAAAGGEGSAPLLPVSLVTAALPSVGMEAVPANVHSLNESGTDRVDGSDAFLGGSSSRVLASSLVAPSSLSSGVLATLVHISGDVSFLNTGSSGSADVEPDAQEKTQTADAVFAEESRDREDSAEGDLFQVHTTSLEETDLSLMDGAATESPPTVLVPRIVLVHDQS